MKNKKLLIEIIGWYGLVAFVVGFALISFEVTEAAGYLYQFLTLSGAVSIVILSLSRKLYQTVVLNGFVIVIAAIAIVRLILG